MLYFFRRCWHRLFSQARRDRQRAILKDFEEELVDRTHRAFVNQVRRQLVLRSTALFFFILTIGSISPNFFSVSETALPYAEAMASSEEDYAQSIFLSIDGYLTKTYAPTEESKGATGIFTVTVKPGDTLSGIGARFGVSVRDLMVNNSLSPNPTLTIGQKITVANGIIHQIAKGDTLDSLANAYGVEKSRILATNEIVEKELKIGSKLIIAGAKNVLSPLMSGKGSVRSSRVARSYADSIAYEVKGGKLLFPTIGKYTQYFRPGHYAVDIANTQSPEILSAQGGTIEKAKCGWNGGYGCHIVINHGDGMKTLYAHMRKIFVTVGEQVVRGQAIGQMGNTGKVHGVTGIHLHFEVIVNGVKRNPIAFF